MSLDIAMGGSTNTVLHLLAAAREAGVNHHGDIDRFRAGCRACRKWRRQREIPHGRRPPRRRRPSHSAELNRAGLLNADVPTVHSNTLGEGLAKWDIKTQPADSAAHPSTAPHRAACLPPSPSARACVTDAGRRPR